MRLLILLIFGISLPFMRSVTAQEIDTALLMGKVRAATQVLSNGVLTPEDAYQLDSKMDDGNVNVSSFVGAGTGSFMAADSADASAGDCVSGSGTAAAYAASNASTHCIVAFAMN